MRLFKRYKWELVAISKYDMYWASHRYHIELYHDSNSGERRYTIKSNTSTRNLYINANYDNFISPAIRWAEGCIVDEGYFNSKDWDMTEYGSMITSGNKRFNIINELYG